jgi:hypothetical protein
MKRLEIFQRFSVFSTTSNFSIVALALVAFLCAWNTDKVAIHLMKTSLHHVFTADGACNRLANPGGFWLIDNSF